MPLTAAIPDARPEAGDFKALRALFGISRSSAYLHEKAGDFTFIRLRKRGNRRGKTLINFDSVRAYLARCESAK